MHDAHYSLTGIHHSLCGRGLGREPLQCVQGLLAHEVARARAVVTPQHQGLNREGQVRVHCGHGLLGKLCNRPRECHEGVVHGRAARAIERRSSIVMRVSKKVVFV